VNPANLFGPLLKESHAPIRSIALRITTLPAKVRAPCFIAYGRRHGRFNVPRISHARSLAILEMGGPSGFFVFAIRRRYRARNSGNKFPFPRRNFRLAPNAIFRIGRPLELSFCHLGPGPCQGRHERKLFLPGLRNAFDRSCRTVIFPPRNRTLVRSRSRCFARWCWQYFVFLLFHALVFYCVRQ